MKRWHLAKCEPQKAAWFTSSLTNMGIEVFYPKVVWMKRGKKKLEPLFPNYVFCRFDPAVANWSSIQWSPGFSCFLGISERPSHVPDELVEYIQHRAESRGKRPLKGGHQVDTAPASNMVVPEIDSVFEPTSGPKRRCKMMLNAVNRAYSSTGARGNLAPITAFS